MNKSQKIYLNTGDTGNQNQDKYIKVKLEQDVDTLEFMSLKIGTADAYQNFNSDYGVLVGRVIANGGIGIPNAKISVFIPLEDTDAENSDIYSIYPYRTPRDKNNDGKRYNLLPRVGTKDPDTEIISPKQPFGSFPIKEEIVGNQPYLNVYKKYYKYTALTNSGGDYMIFGIPTGTQTIHLSVDITDIGKYSMTPAAMVTNLGYSPNFFTNNNSKIKPSSDLNDLPNIETQEISVDVIPFWGDSDNFEIGITRQDFRIRSTISNTFVIFGSAFTDGENNMWGTDFSGSRYISELYRAKDIADETIGMISKRIGKITEKIYYYPNSITDEQIDNGNVDPKNDMILLDPSEYSVYKREGDFVFIISCNRNKIVTDDLGNEISVPEDSTNGVFTKFRGFITLEITPDDIPMNFSDNIGNNTKLLPFRYRLKFPQYADRNHSFARPDGSGIEDTNTINWRKEHFVFSGGNYYSFSRFHGLTWNDEVDDTEQFLPNGELFGGFFLHDFINKASDNSDPFWNVGIIATNDYSDYNNSQYEFPSNSKTGDILTFGANWINLSVYFPQVGFLSAGYSHVSDVRSTDNFTKNNKDDGGNVYYYDNNTQIIAGGNYNTKWFARADLHWTDIIEVPLKDIKSMNNPNLPKGFNDTYLSLNGSKYRNGSYIPTGWNAACPINGGKKDGNPNEIVDTQTYFYKGFNDANCIEYLFELGIIN